ncbi:MAG: NAD(P)H-binding protein, partial [Planctomycetota bacterium]
MSQGVILLTGAAGYVGKRLLPRLVNRGLRVRCLSRRPHAAGNPRAQAVEWVQGDVLDEESLRRALNGVSAAYYLVHSLDHPGDFEAMDRQAAMAFAQVAKRQGVGRIIYLGGLGDSDQILSSHLASRQEVGRILRAFGPEVIELRASVIIGSGSLSFELVRALVERLPGMVCPRWVRTATQPIGTEDLLDYLVAALDLPPGRGAVYEIGGPEQVSYADIMRAYAMERGLRRIMIPVPVLTPWLSSLWLALVTPVYARVGRHLIEGVRNPTVVRDTLARETFAIRPRGLRECIRAALVEEDCVFDTTPLGDLLP